MTATTDLGLADRAIHAAQVYRCADPDGFHRRHDTPDQWNRWARRARVARTVAAALQVPVDAVLVTDDAHRTYRTRTGPVPGDLITVTDSSSGRVWRFISDFTTPGDGWLLLDRCPECEAEIPVVRVAGLVDLGEYLDPDGDLWPCDEARDESLHQPGCAGAISNRYHFTRIVEIAGRTVRARVERDVDPDRSLAVVEVLTDQMSWTRIADDAPGNWWRTTPLPHPQIPAAAVLGPLADRLLHRAADILAPPPTTLTLSPRVLDAVSALLATSYGYNSERRIDPDEITWATTHGGALHIIEHADGSVTFTKEHRDACPFITSAGVRECDEDCLLRAPR